MDTRGLEARRGLLVTVHSAKQNCVSNLLHRVHQGLWKIRRISQPG